MGSGVVNCLQAIRVHAAALEILNGESSIQALAQNAGFSDPKYFSRVFKQIVGESPSAYIKRLQDERASGGKA